MSPHITLILSNAMQNQDKHRTRAYVLARQQHPAWLLLASRTGPAVLGCLQSLFSSRPPDSCCSRNTSVNSSKAVSNSMPSRFSVKSDCKQPNTAGPVLDASSSPAGCCCRANTYARVRCLSWFCIALLRIKVMWGDNYYTA